MASERLRIIIHTNNFIGRYRIENRPIDTAHLDESPLIYFHSDYSLNSVASATHSPLGANFR